MLFWLWLSLSRRQSTTAAPAPPPARAASAHPGARARGLALLAFVTLGLQITLGGWTSSNYAAVACPDFPLCQGAWWPETNFQDAFVLWRGLGINYEGGILDHPARVAIHLTHRIGAIIASLALLLAAWMAFRWPQLQHARSAAVAVLATLALQLLIGITMVLGNFPLSLATAHNAGAALLVLAMVAFYRQLSRAPARAAAPELPLAAIRSATRP
jgi:heme a synthase